MIAKTSLEPESAPLEAAPERLVSALPRAEASGQLSGWGRIPAPGRELTNERFEALTRGATLARGLGR
jgi:hypothetical protein